MTGLDQKIPGVKVNGRFSFEVKNVSSYQNSFELLIKDLTRWKKEGYRVVLLSASRTRASRLAGDLREYDLRAYCPDGAKRSRKGRQHCRLPKAHLRKRPSLRMPGAYMCRIFAG